MDSAGARGPDVLSDGTTWTTYFDRAEEWVRSTVETGEASEAPEPPALPLTDGQRGRLLALLAGIDEAQRRLAERRTEIGAAAARVRAYSAT